MESPPLATLAEVLADLGWFGDLGAGELEAIAARFAVTTLESGEVLFRQGDFSDAIHLVLAGAIELRVVAPGRPPQALPPLGPGDVLGEIAVLAGGVRSATATAREATQLASLPASDFQDLLAEHPGAAATFEQIATTRLHRSQLFAQLARRFPGLTSEALGALAQQVEWVTLRGGEPLFAQGAPGDSAYLLVSGRVLVQVEQPEGAPRTIAELGPGELVGEYALISEEPRGASVLAKKDSHLARFPRETFLDLVRTRSEILLELTRTILRRGRESTLALARERDRHRAIALVDLDPDCAWFAEVLRTELAKHGETILLDAALVDGHLGKPGIAQSRPGEPGHIRLLQWLEAVEAAHRFTLLRPGAPKEPWTETVLRQADEVAYVAPIATAPGPRDVEAGAVELRRRCHHRASLILLHEPGAEHPRTTAAWLAARDVDAAYQVRRDDPGDYGRIGRILAGCALGVVLAGGGARGFAHLGVFRALEELGVAIDMIGGTSMGAPIAMLAALGHSAARCQEISRKRFSGVWDYTFPVASILAGTRVNNSVVVEAGGWDIEDVWRPYFCISTNLTKAREERHLRGDAALAIRASLSIPGLLPPVPDGENLLVDGGVMNNFPIDVMRLINPTGTVLAVEVSSPDAPAPNTDYGMTLSGWDVLASRYIPGRDPMAVPGIGGTILGSMLVGADRERALQLEADLADMVLDLKVPGISLLDFERVDEAAEIGYRQALPALREWLERR